MIRLYIIASDSNQKLRSVTSYKRIPTISKVTYAFAWTVCITRVSIGGSVNKVFAHRQRLRGAALKPGRRGRIPAPPTVQFELYRRVRQTRLQCRLTPTPKYLPNSVLVFVTFYLCLCSNNPPSWLPEENRYVLHNQASTLRLKAKGRLRFYS